MAPLSVIFALCIIGAARAIVTLPSIFSDGCVLQTTDENGTRPQVYGWAAADEVVQIRLSWNSGKTENFSARAGQDGKWVVTIPALPVADGSFDLNVTGTIAPVESIYINGCVAGDVLLCGGQSNMCFSAESAFPPGPALAAQSYPNIRLFAVHQTSAHTPQHDFAPVNETSQCWWNHDQRPPGNKDYLCNKWMPSKPSTNGLFSAVCLFTALQLAAKHTAQRPLGLIYSAVGGTSINLWAPDSAIGSCPTPEPPAVVGTLYNAMIAPLDGYPVRSVLWFQGENDAASESTTPNYYECRLLGLIPQWQGLLGNASTPFSIVNLGAINNTGDSYGAIRMAQETVLLGAPTTRMALAYDLGDPTQVASIGSVHFRNKTEVGRRLALAVINSTYPAAGDAAVDWSGPSVTDVTSNAQANLTVRVTLATWDGQGVTAVGAGGNPDGCSAPGTLEFATGPSGPWFPSGPLQVEGGGFALIATATVPNSGYSHVRYACSDSAFALHASVLATQPTRDTVRPSPSPL